MAGNIPFPHVKRIKDILYLKVDLFIEFVNKARDEGNDRRIDVFLDILDKNSNLMDDIEIYFNILTNILYFFDREGVLRFEDLYDSIRESVLFIERVCNECEYKDNNVRYSKEFFNCVLTEITYIQRKLENLYYFFNSEMRKNGVSTTKREKTREELLEDLETSIKENERKRKKKNK